MPRYTFKLSDDGSGVEDDVGVTLPTAEIAYRYACDVVRELMHCRELRTRHWQLDVYEDERQKVFEIPFVVLDPTINHLTAEQRQLVERGSRIVRSFRNTLDAASRWWRARVASRTLRPIAAAR